MKMYWHKMTPILVHALVKFRSAINDKGVNSVHLKKDMDDTRNELTRHERSNWTKLRFHGMVAKVRKEDKTQVRGHWLLTKRGASFLNGLCKTPYEVQTFRNKVVDHSDQMVSVAEVIGSTPYVETIDDIQYEVFEPKELKLF